MILEPSMTSARGAAAFGLCCVSKKTLFTNKVATRFFDSQSESMAGTLPVLVTAGSRISGQVS